MALNGNPLVNGYMNFGQFDLFKSSGFLTRKRLVINRLINLLIFFNASKFLVILLAEWFEHFDLKPFLIDLFLFDYNQQKLIDVSISIIHIGCCAGFSYWSSLAEKVSSLESFRFLLLHHSKDRYRQRYHLDRKSTDKFLAAYRFGCLFLWPLMAAYYILVLAAILRCLCESFSSASLIYFLSVGLPLSVITLFDYLLLVLFVIPKFILLLLSTEFLVLRVKAINSLICSRFIGTKPPSISRPMKWRKQKATTLKILRLLNDFCRQFKEVNSVLDSCISPILLGAYILLFFIPYSLIFVEIVLGMRLILSVLIVAIYLFCFFTSICNDRLRKQVSQRSKQRRI